MPVAIGTLCEEWTMSPPAAAEYIRQNPDHVLGLMKFATHKAIEQDPALEARIERSKGYLNSKPQEA